MNLSFSTRGWQRYSWEENLKTALTMHFGGIEIYNPQREESLIGRGCPFHQYSVAATIRDLKTRGLSIPCIDTSCDLSEASSVEELRTVMALARNAQVTYVSCCALGDEEPARASID